MIRFVYPNVRDGKFIGCGRLAAFADGGLPDGYELHYDPDLAISQVIEAALLLDPESAKARQNIYESRDDPQQHYFGHSLDLAYLLTLISRSGTLRLELPQGDIWCTGQIELAGREPVLKAVSTNEFLTKLEAFWSDKNPDLLFIVPDANIEQDQPLVQSLREVEDLSVISLDAFSAQDLTERKTILKVRRYELPALVDALFVEPNHANIEPYRGLSPFQEEDEKFFFGRAQYITQLVAAVRQQPFVAVIGASGSGKSSVIYAGLIPHLRRRDDWLIMSFHPGKHPLHSLSSALIPLLDPNLTKRAKLVESKAMAEDFRMSRLSVNDVVENILHESSCSRLLVFVDQFEELYTYERSHDPNEQRRFLDGLLQICEIFKTSQVSVVLTMRADFLGKALVDRPFADRLQQAALMLGPLNQAELRETIKKPAEFFGVAIEEGLTDRILEVVSDEPGYLPLLEFALTELWQRRTNNTLTHAAYREIGGVEQALARYADRAYAELSAEEQQQTKRILTQLVHPGQGTEDTRRVALGSEIGEVHWELVKKLADERLVVTRGGPTAEKEVELVHEALITGWQRLQEWINADREFLMWRERLRAAIQQWEHVNRDKDALLRGVRLAETEEQFQEQRENLSQQEKTYIEASINQREQERAASEQVRKERERLQQRVARNLKIFLVSALALLALAGWQWWRAERNAELSKQVAEQSEQVAEQSRQASDYLNTGINFLNRSQYPEALEYFEKALRINQKIVYPRGEADTLSSIGDVYNNLYQYEKALEYYSQTLEIHRDINDKSGAKNALHDIGGIYTNLGKYQQALEYFEQALTITRETNNRQGIITTLVNIGVVYAYLGQRQQALQYSEQALTMARELNSRSLEGSLLSYIGDVHQILKQYKEALPYYEQALAINREIGDRDGESNILSDIGNVHQILKQYKEALPYYEQALTINREIGDRRGERKILINIRDVYVELGNFSKVSEYQEKAWKLELEPSRHWKIIEVGSPM